MWLSPLLKSHTTSERRAETNAEAEANTEQETPRREAEQNQKSSAQRREQNRGAEVQRRKGENRQSSVQKEERENTSRNAGEKRSYIGSARASGVHGDCSHAHTKRDAHLASLTQLTGATHARSCVKRVRAQRRLRGNPQTRGAYDCAT